MNIIRTVPQYETQRWVDLLFHPGPPKGPKDPNPLTYPMSAHLSQDVVGGFLYIVYQAQVIGYAPIVQVEAHDKNTVGEEAEPIAAGDTVIIQNALTRMPFPLTCRGFRRYRYISMNLHEVSQNAARTALTEMGLL